MSALQRLESSAPVAGHVNHFPPAGAQASSLQLKNMVLDNQAGSIMARFGIELVADAQVEDALLNGIKT